MQLQELYKKEITGKLKEKLAIKNIMAVPKVVKVVVASGVGEAKENPKLIDIVSKDIMTITGQKPKITKAKKAISGFKIRQGDKIGLKVTLRHNKMYNFLERLSRIALPRIRDFRGLKMSGFDGRGNYTLGMKEQTIFPEIKYDKVEKTFGFQVGIVTTAKDDNDAKELLIALGFPFQKKEHNG